MTVGEIKKKSSELFTEYLNFTIDKICGITKSNEKTNSTNSDDFFPLEILKNNNRFSDMVKEHSQEMAELFHHSKNKTGVGYSLEIETISTRSNGKKSIIRSVFFADENDFLDFINVKERVNYLKSALVVLSQDSVLPNKQLSNWAKKHIRDLTIPHSDTEQTIFWHNIAQCALWVNPQNKKKNNELPLHIPADFIETNKSLIQSLSGDADSDFQIPSSIIFPKNDSPTKDQPTIESVEDSKVDLKTKPFSIRFRSLSSDTPLKLGRLVPKEIALPLDDFVHLNQTNFLKEITTVLIVNSETIFQTFPVSEHVLCIFGPDFAVNALKLCDWFVKYQIIYFGDISEHCFDVLSAFRNSWFKTESICMDGNTWEKFLTHADSGAHLRNNAVPKNLSEAEKNCFLALRLTPGKSRLTQEKIPLEYMSSFLEAIKVCNEESDEK